MCLSLGLKVTMPMKMVATLLLDAAGRCINSLTSTAFELPTAQSKGCTMTWMSSSTNCSRNFKV